jgi:hypothetical protein
LDFTAAADRGDHAIGHLNNSIQEWGRIRRRIYRASEENERLRACRDSAGNPRAKKKKQNRAAEQILRRNRPYIRRPAEKRD